MHACLELGVVGLCGARLFESWCGDGICSVVLASFKSWCGDVSGLRNHISLRSLGVEICIKLSVGLAPCTDSLTANIYRYGGVLCWI